MSRAVLVWGAVVGGRRAHVFATWREVSPPGPPKSLCRNAQSPEKEIKPAGDVPQCLRCAYIARAWLADGRATADDGLEETG